MAGNIYEWTVECKSGLHIVRIKRVNNKHSDIYVDTMLIKRINNHYFFNYEYEFDVEENKCAIVKLVIDQEPGFVVNGIYKNKSRPYRPLTVAPTFLKVLAVLSFFGFLPLLYSYCTDKGNFVIRIIATLYWIVYVIGMRLFPNSPCVIKNKGGNLFFRVLCTLIMTLIYVLLVLYMFLAS